jgi:predicted metalloprotease
MQNLMGITDMARGVRQRGYHAICGWLQADCLPGIHNHKSSKNAISGAGRSEEVTQRCPATTTLESAKVSTVVPDSFTHREERQRQR